MASEVSQVRNFTIWYIRSQSSQESHDLVYQKSVKSGKSRSNKSEINRIRSQSSQELHDLVYQKSVKSGKSRSGISEVSEVRKVTI